MITLLLTSEEVDALAVAVAKSVAPQTTPAPTNAAEASAVVWSFRGSAGSILCSLATMLAEANSEPSTPMDEADAADLALVRRLADKLGVDLEGECVRCHHRSAVHGRGGCEVGGDLVGGKCGCPRPVVDA